MSILVLVVPVALALAAFILLFPPPWTRDWSFVVLGTVLVGAMPAYSALAALNPGGVACVVQVGAKGISLGRKAKWSTVLLRSGWIAWENLRMDPRGFGDRWGRTLHIYNGDDDGAPHLIDYNQARAILMHPDSRGALTSYPPWFEQLLGLPRAVVLVRGWGEEKSPGTVQFN